MKHILVAELFDLIGCDPDFPERYQVEGYRVLGAVANPPAVGPEDTFSIELVEANGDNATYRWSVCLINLGSNFEFNAWTVPRNPLESETSSIQVDRTGRRELRAAITAGLPDKR